MKNIPGTLSIDFACLQISPFETVFLYSFWAIPLNKIGKHVQVKHFPNGNAKHARLVNDLSVSATSTKPVVNANQHLLSNDQSNACVAGTTRSVNASYSDVSTVPLRHPPHQDIWKSRWPPLTARCAIFRRSHENIGDCEQSKCDSVFDTERMMGNDRKGKVGGGVGKDVKSIIKPRCLVYCSLLEEKKRKTVNYWTSFKWGCC